MLNQSSLKTKLLFAFGVVALFVLSVAGVGYFSMKKVQSEYGYISNVIVDNIQKVGDISSKAHEANRALLRSWISFAGQDYEGIKKYLHDFNSKVEEVNKVDAAYRSTPFAPHEEELYNAAWKDWLVYKNLGDKYFKLLNEAVINKTDAADAKTVLDEEIRGASNTFRASFEKLMAFQNNLQKEKSASATEAYELASLLNSIISLLGLVVAVVVGFLFSNSISKTFTKIASDIMSSAEETAAASQQLTSASSSLSQGATESAASLEETVSSLEELSSMVKLNSDHAREANSISQRSLKAAETGEKEIGKLIIAMEEMSKSSKKIEEIINVIDDIAFQTNLLALNAAVEAARAGDQGKGFAVVADAVRNLAGRSASAAKDINTLIKESVEKTENGVQIADSSDEALKEILNSVKKVADLNSEISAASQEQANGIEQISKAMNHLDQAIQSNAASSEEVASSATEMSSQADALSGLVLDMRNYVEGGSSPSQHVVHKQRSTKPQGPAKAKKSHLQILPLDDKEASEIGKAEGF